MAAAQQENQSSHKRSSSVAENSTSNLPDTKKQTLVAPNPAVSASAENTPNPPKEVYVLQVERLPAYSDSSTDIYGVYATLQDANNALRKFVLDEYYMDENSRHGTRADGTVWWSSDDVGEGDQAKVSIRVLKVSEAGSVPECTWEDDGHEVSEDEY
jgi:hypothetical protein